MTARSACSSRSARPTSPATKSKPGSMRAPSATSPPANPPAAPPPGTLGDVDARLAPVALRHLDEAPAELHDLRRAWRPSAGRTRWRRRRSASSRRRRRRARSRRSAAGEPTASKAPSPPSVVDDPPQPITMRRAPASRAARRSWPTPVVLARTGSSPRGRGSRARPAARDISTTAVSGAAPSGPPSMRHSASTRAPSGPVTTVVCGVPPRARSRPSPPSDMGTSSAVQPAARAASGDGRRHLAGRRRPPELSGAATRWGTRDEATGCGTGGLGCGREDSNLHPLSGTGT